MLDFHTALSNSGNLIVYTKNMAQYILGLPMPAGYFIVLSRIQGYISTYSRDSKPLLVILLSFKAKHQSATIIISRFDLNIIFQTIFILK